MNGSQERDPEGHRFPIPVPFYLVVRGWRREPVTFPEGKVYTLEVRGGVCTRKRCTICMCKDQGGVTPILGVHR